MQSYVDVEITLAEGPKIPSASHESEPISVSLRVRISGRRMADDRTVVRGCRGGRSLSIGLGNYNRWSGFLDGPAIASCPRQKRETGTSD